MTNLRERSVALPHEASAQAAPACGPPPERGGGGGVIASRAVALMVEQRTPNPRVGGSSPSCPALYLGGVAPRRGALAPQAPRCSLRVAKPRFARVGRGRFGPPSPRCSLRVAKPRFARVGRGRFGPPSPRCSLRVAKPRFARVGRGRFGP